MRWLKTEIISLVRLIIKHWIIIKKIMMIEIFFRCFASIAPIFDECDIITSIWDSNIVIKIIEFIHHGDWMIKIRIRFFSFFFWWRWQFTTSNINIIFAMATVAIIDADWCWWWWLIWWWDIYFDIIIARK